MKKVLKVALSVLLLTGVIGFTALQTNDVKQADPGTGVKPDPRG